MSQSRILEPARETPVIHRTDVVVVGSGPAGLAAALAAARAGSRSASSSVSAVRRQHHRGRRRGLGMVPPRGHGRGRRHRAGIREPGQRHGAAMPESQSLSIGTRQRGVQAGRRRARRGGRHSSDAPPQFVAPMMDGDAMTGVIAESKAGREAIRANRVIDATGDADMAHRAGAPTARPRGRRCRWPASCSTSPAWTTRPSSKV